MASFKSNHQNENSHGMNQQNSKGSGFVPRILIVDDNEAIHSDFNKILGVQNSDSDSFKDARAAFFGTNESQENTFQEYNYHIDSAFQGKQALEMVTESLEQKHPYTLAFVDMRMPPVGMDLKPSRRSGKKIRRSRSSFAVLIPTILGKSTIKFSITLTVS